jgi:uncharacterized membrane protein YqiK
VSGSAAWKNSGVTAA